MRFLRPAALVFLLLALTGAGAGALWYRLDPPAAMAAACRIGLPNFSRPPQIEAHVLGCNILGPKRRVSGVLLSAFEASNFDSPELGPPPPGKGLGTTWYSGTQTLARNAALDRQMATPIPGLCEINLASVTVEGWATVSPGHYGHMGVYSRRFFADRVIAAGPPPPAFVARLRAEFAKGGFDPGDCPGL